MYIIIDIIVTIVLIIIFIIIVIVIVIIMTKCDFTWEQNKSNLNKTDIFVKHWHRKSPTLPQRLPCRHFEKKKLQRIGNVHLDTELPDNESLVFKCHGTSKQMRNIITMS